MSHLKVEKIEPYVQSSSKESKKISNIKFKGKNAYLNSDTRPQPGGTVQVVHRAVRNATTIGTRGNYDEFFAKILPGSLSHYKFLSVCDLMVYRPARRRHFCRNLGSFHFMFCSVHPIGQKR